MSVLVKFIESVLQALYGILIGLFPLLITHPVNQMEFLVNLAR